MTIFLFTINSFGMVFASPAEDINRSYSNCWIKSYKLLNKETAESWLNLPCIDNHLQTITLFPLNIYNPSNEVCWFFICLSISCTITIQKNQISLFLFSCPATNQNHSGNYKFQQLVLLYIVHLYILHGSLDFTKYLYRSKRHNHITKPYNTIISHNHITQPYHTTI